MSTVASLLKDARATLGNNFSAALDSRLLLQEAAGLTHEDIVADPEREIGTAAFEKFNALLARRLKHEPVSRILARREFFGRVFKITPDVLDPRPDTEALVELALEYMKQGTFLDIGTGSGAIAISLCAENKVLGGLATDVSAAALAVATENARTLAVADRLQFHHGGWFDGVSRKFDLIISNPPYVPAGTELMPDVMNYDPHSALFGGTDGLNSYRGIASGAAAHLNAGGTVMVEIGLGQAPQVAALFAAQGFELCAQAEDLGGRLRALGFKPR